MEKADPIHSFRGRKDGSGAAGGSVEGPPRLFEENYLAKENTFSNSCHNVCYFEQ
jgi:hypothetical protein